MISEGNFVDLLRLSAKDIFKQSLKGGEQPLEKRAQISMKKNANAEKVAATENATTENQSLTVSHIATEQTAETETPTSNQEQEQPRESQVKTIGQIIEKHNKITETVKGLQSLDEAYKELDSICLSKSPKLRDTLTLSDGRGETFETSNGFLIENCIAFLKSKIEERTVELEKDLQRLEAA